MISKSNSKLILLITAFAVFLATFNETFLNIAFNTIGGDLGIDFSVVQWLATGYMLGAAIMVPISAFMYRRVPTKILFLCTVACFVIGSVVAGLSQSFILLLIGRIIQALGSGLLIPIAMNIVLDIAPKDKLGSYMGIMGAMTTLGPSLSLIIAGALLSFADWHVLFWVFGGLSLVLFVLAAIFLGNVAKLGKPRLDVLSVVLISLALVGILYAISTVFTCWWLALCTFVVGVVMLVLFLLRQKRIPEPLINLAPFRSKVFNCGLLVNVITLVMIFAFNIVVPYVLAERGVSALISSLVLFPAIFLSCIVAPIAGKLYDRFGTKFLLPVGMAMMAAFAVLLAFFISSPSIILLSALYIPFIVGSALIIGPAQSHALSHLEPQNTPHGVTIFSTGFQVAGCIGASLFSSIYSATAVSFGSASQAFLLVGLIVAAFAILGLIISIVINRISPKNSITEPTPTPLDDKISSIMIADVYSVSDTTPIIDAMRLFVDKKISGCPIVDTEGKFVGFVSDGDIIRFLAKNNTNFKTVYSYIVTNGIEGQLDTKLRELLTLPALQIAGKDLCFVTPDQSLGDACQVLAATHKKKVVVLQDDKIVGVVTRSDITKQVMNFSIRAYEKQNSIPLDLPPISDGGLLDCSQEPQKQA